jgi:HEAT repeats
MRIILAYTLAACTAVPLVCGQQANTSRSSVSELLAKLQSKDPTERSLSYDELRSDAEAMRSKEVQAALLDLLDREDREIESTLRASHEQEGVGEGYAEYVAELGETVDSYADWTDPRQVCILVQQAYEWDTRFAAKIAAHARVSIPCLIQMYRSDVGLTRAEAAPTLVRALADKKDGLDPETAQKARQVILRALQDPSEAVRSKTVMSLERFGTPDMIPALKEVAKSDPAGGGDHGFWIREYAVRAIAAIQSRTAQP